MSDQQQQPPVDGSDDDDAQPDADEMIQRSRKDLRGLERAAREGRKATAENAQLARRIALMEAGIPSSGIGKLFSKAYDGELTPEAIKSAADEYGIFDGDNSNSSAISDNLSAQQRLAANSTGAQGSGNPDVVAELNAAKNPEEIMAIARKYNLRGIDLRQYGG